MPTLGPTSMLDPFVEGWAREAGIPTETLGSMVGGNIIGGLVGIPLDMFLTQLGSKIASVFVGAVPLLLGTYAFKGRGRLQLDSMQIGSRIITEILDPSPQQIKEIQKNVGDLIDGLIQGRWDKVAYAFIRNPRELTSMLPETSQPVAPQRGAPAEKPTQLTPPATEIVMRL